MNNNLIWAKTLLSVYRYFQRIAGALDKVILQSGMNCTSVCLQNFFQNNAFAVSNKIIELSQRKVTIINLKILTEDVLSEINQQDAQILIEKFVEGKKAKALAENFDISLRTIFRKIDCALGSFASRMTAKGFSHAKLCKMCEKEAWINSVFERFANKEAEEFQLSNAFLQKAVSM